MSRWNFFDRNGNHTGSMESDDGMSGDDGSGFIVLVAFALACCVAFFVGKYFAHLYYYLIPIRSHVAGAWFAGALVSGILSYIFFDFYMLISAGALGIIILGLIGALAGWIVAIFMGVIFGWIAGILVAGFIAWKMYDS
jgi:hypothetical protein